MMSCNTPLALNKKSLSPFFPGMDGVGDSSLPTFLQVYGMYMTEHKTVNIEGGRSTYEAL